MVPAFLAKVVVIHADNERGETTNYVIWHSLVIMLRRLFNASANSQIQLPRRFS